MSSSPPPVVADRYRLVAPLGQGGMGRVWRATDVVLHREVAIKELVPPPGLTPSERQEMRERSLREARAIARLNNINVVRVFDVLSTDADPWIVMEYVPSRSLQDVLAQDGPFNALKTADIGLGVLNALRAAHRNGVVHRDVKPGNVLMGADGRVVLTDFGLATVPGDPNVTRTGLVLGSPAYIAPERARDGTAGPAADLWSLGATLYAAVEGQSPFARPSAIATLAALATENVPVARNAGPLKPVLNGLLRKDPAHRINAEEADRLLSRAAGRRSKITFPMSPSMRRPGVGRERPSLPSGPGGPPVLPGSGWATATGSAPVVPNPRPPVAQPPAADGRPPHFAQGKAQVSPEPPRRPAKPLDATRIDTPPVRDEIKPISGGTGHAPVHHPGPQQRPAPGQYPQAPGQFPTVPDRRATGRSTVSRPPADGPSAGQSPASPFAGQQPIAGPSAGQPPTGPSAGRPPVGGPSAGRPPAAGPSAGQPFAGPSAGQTAGPSAGQPLGPSAGRSPVGGPATGRPSLPMPSAGGKPVEVPQSLGNSAAPTNALRTGFTAADVAANRRKQAAPEHEQSLAHATSGFPIVTPRNSETSEQSVEDASAATETKNTPEISGAGTTAGSRVEQTANPGPVEALEPVGAESVEVGSGALTGNAQSDESTAAAPASESEVGTPVVAVSPNSTEESKPAEPSKAAENTKAAESPKAAESASVMESAGATESAKATESAGVAEAFVVTEASKATEDSTAAENAKAVEAPAPGESSNTTDSSRVTDSSKAAETPEIAATPVSTETAETVDPAESPESSPSAALSNPFASANAAGPAVDAPEVVEPANAGGADSVEAPKAEDKSEEKAPEKQWPPVEAPERSAVSEHQAVAERTAGPDRSAVPDGSAEEKASLLPEQDRSAGERTSLLAESDRSVEERTSLLAKPEPAVEEKTSFLAPAPVAKNEERTTLLAPMSPAAEQTTMLSPADDRTSLLSSPVDNDRTSVVSMPPRRRIVTNHPAPQPAEAPGFNRPNRPAWTPMELRPTGRRGVTIFGTTLTRRQAAIGLAIVLTFVLLIGIIVAQAFGSDDSGDGTPVAQGGVGSSAAPSVDGGGKAPTGASAKPTAPSSPAAVAVPDGWRTANFSGLSIPVPDGAKSSGGGSAMTYSWGKYNGRQFRIDVVSGKQDPVNYLKDDGSIGDVISGPAAVDWNGKSAADVEYYRGGSSYKQHVIRRVVSSGGSTYAFTWYATTDDWSKSQSDLKVIWANLKF